MPPERTAGTEARHRAPPAQTFAALLIIDDMRAPQRTGSPGAPPVPAQAGVARPIRLGTRQGTAVRLLHGMGAHPGGA